MIDRAELIQHLNECLTEKSRRPLIVNAVLMAIKCFVEQMPTIEKRGEWEYFVEKSFNGEVVEVDNYRWRCSHCKTPLADTVGGYWDDDSEKPTVNYCPHCGADMRGKKK